MSKIKTYAKILWIGLVFMIIAQCKESNMSGAKGETNHAISWFELPAKDFSRAVKFYKTILKAEIAEVDMGEIRMGMLPRNPGSVSGAIVKGGDYTPSGQGTLVYLNGGKDLSEILARVEGAGGKIIVTKTQISPEFGFFALLIDTEGNRVGLHSMQ
ncbi:VOC family protein [Leptospira sp. WS92.C1]